MVGFVFSPLTRYSFIIQCWNYCFDTFKLLHKYNIYFEGTAMHTFLFVGFGKSFGLFFVQSLAVYNTNSSMMSIILGLQTIVISISGKFLFHHFTYQNCSHGVVFYFLFCLLLLVLHLHTVPSDWEWDLFFSSPLRETTASKRSRSCAGPLR